MPKKSTYKEAKLFVTDDHIVSHILDDGDNSEPPHLCRHSLIRLHDDFSRKEIILTGEELDDLAIQWLRLRLY